MTTALPWGDTLPDILIHVTSTQALANISLHGLPAGAQWANADVAAYHARLLEDAGHTPAILSLPLKALRLFQPGPDWAALECPPLEVLMRDTAALAFQWTSSEPTAANSLGLLGSCRTQSSIPAAVLHSHLPHLREQSSRARQQHRRAPKKRHKVKRR